MKNPTINNWSTTRTCSDPYKAPEQSSLKLQGEVTGYPGLDGEHHITTSKIIAAEGLLVTCESRIYELGTIDPGFTDWLKKNRPDWDPDNPITIIQDRMS